MRKPLFCIWQEDFIELIEQKRKLALETLELISDKAIPIFDEATQTIANILDLPVAVIGIAVDQEYCLKSASGLSNLGLMNKLATDRKMSREEAFASNVIDSIDYLVIDDVLNSSFFSESDLCQHYGVRAYLGVPLISSDGTCIGCLEAIDTQPRQFTDKEINYVMITARWCMAEYERNQLIKKSERSLNKKSLNTDISSSNSFQTLPTTEEIASEFSPREPQNIPEDSYVRQLTSLLLSKLTSKLSIPLTSVIGMSSVLKQEIYGELNPKQLEYIKIIHDSGQDVSILTDEICQLTNLENQLELEIVPVDLENLGKKAISTLKSIADNREQTLRLSIEPGQKVWRLDREKLQKTLYYLLITIIESSRTGGEINIHISQRSEQLRISCSINHPWLGDGISLEKVNLYRESLKYNGDSKEVTNNESSFLSTMENKNLDYDLISLLFSAYLANLQGGSINLRGSVESGHRFILSIPLSLN